jgi:hypothetical protein
MAEVDELSDHIGVTAACQELDVPRSSWYRARQSRTNDKARSRPTSKHALNQDEKTQVRDILNSDRFADSAPRERR